MPRGYKTYDVCCDVVQRQRHMELTGRALPEPAPFEDVLGLVPPDFDLDAAMERVDDFFGQMEKQLAQVKGLPTDGESGCAQARI